MVISQKLKDVFEEEMNTFFEENFDKNNVETFGNIADIYDIKKVLHNIYDKKYIETLSMKSDELFSNVDIFKSFIEKYNEHKNKFQDKELFYEIYNTAFDLIYLFSLHDLRTSRHSTTNEYKVKTSLFYKEIVDDLKDKYVKNFRKAFQREGCDTIGGLLISKFEDYSVVYKQTITHKEILGFFVEKDNCKVLITLGSEYRGMEKRFSVFLFKNQECHRMTLYSLFDHRRKRNLEGLGFTFEDLNESRLSGVSFASREKFHYFNRELEDNGKYKIKVFDSSDQLVSKVFKRTFKDGLDIALSFTRFEDVNNYIDKHYAKYLGCETTSKNNYWREYFEKTFNTTSYFRGHVVVKDFDQAQDFLDLYDLEFSS